MTATDISPYLAGPFAPIHTEISVAELKVEGRIPDDLSGMFVRNGSNPRFAPKGRYHWFDGDGMLHGIRFEGGRASYANRWVRTAGLDEEMQKGEAVYTGIMEPPNFRRTGGPFKDTANTDLVFHDGRLLSLWWLGGKCHQVELPSLFTRGVREYGSDGNRLAGGLSSHPKLDPVTGELMYFDHKMTPPFLRYGVISSDGTKVHEIAIDLSGARLQHDMAITERYSILLDLPLLWDPELLARGKARVRFRKDLPARFGILPRHGDSSSLRWFEAESCYMYHTINAWEEGDEVVLLGCRIADPLATERAGERGAGLDGKILPHLDAISLEPYLHEWRFNLRTGATKETQLDEVMTEFPRMNNQRLGRPTRYSYNPRVAQRSELLFDGVVKYDTHARSSRTYAYAEGQWGGEVAFAPRAGAQDSSDEDDGYLISFVLDEKNDRSEVFVYDAHDPSVGPLARVQIPQRVPIGYHSWWVSEADLGRQKLGPKGEG